MKIKNILLATLALFTSCSKKPQIDILFEKLDKGEIRKDLFQYEVYKLVIKKVNEDKWPDLSYLSEAEKNLLVFVDFEGQVNNGGFDQYYFNSYGDTAKEAVKALEAMGAIINRDLLVKSFEVFPNKNPNSDQDKRWEQLDLLTEKDNEFLSKLDEEFYNYPEPLDELIINYLRGNIEQFK